MHSCSIVIPVYNEVDSLSQLLGEMTSVLNGNLLYEIILIDDSSEDDPQMEIMKHLQKDLRLTLIQLQNHHGKSAAMLIGMMHAQNDVIVTYDADLQCDPNDILKLVPLLKLNSIVCGYRESRTDGWWRTLSSKVSNGIRKLILHDTIIDAASPIKIFYKKDLVIIPPLRGVHRFLGTLFNHAGYTVIQESINHRPRKYGKSKYGTVDRFLHTSFDLLGFCWYFRRIIDLQNINYYTHTGFEDRIKQSEVKMQ